jgi:nucleoside-diphosphate-sugar epimerase
VVHGPLVYGETGAAIPGLLVEAALRTERVAVPSGVDPVWSTVHVSDWACLVVRAALRTPVGGNAYVAAGSLRRIADVCATVADALGLRPPVPVTAAEATDLWAPLGPALFLDQRFRRDRAERMLDWVPLEDDPLGEIARLAEMMRAGIGGGPSA